MFLKFVHHFLSIVPTIARCSIFRFRVTWRRNQVKGQCFKVPTAIINGPYFSKLCTVYCLSVVSTNLAPVSFSISGHVTQKIGKTSQIRIPSQASFSKLCASIPFSSPYNCAVSDFSILDHVTQKLGQKIKYRLPSQPLSVGQCFRNIIHYFLTIVPTIAPWPIFRFWITWHKNLVKSRNVCPSPTFYISQCFRNFVHYSVSSQ